MRESCVQPSPSLFGGSVSQNLHPQENNLDISTFQTRNDHYRATGEVGAGGLTPLYGLYRMSGVKGYGFSDVLVINIVSILADFGYYGHK